MVRLFRFKRRKDETWVEYHTRCCKAARKIWIHMGLPFQYEIVADGYVIRGLMQSSIP